MPANDPPQTSSTNAVTQSEQQLDWLLAKLRQLHSAVRDKVVATFEQFDDERLAAIDAQSLAAEAGAGDLVFPIDRVSEEELLSFLNREIASELPIVVVCEGLPGDGVVTLPEGTAEADAAWRLIIDPIDGTRGLMYQKRPGWVLTGVAPNRGSATTLADIELAVMTEIPLVKQHLCDQLWARNSKHGRGVAGVRINRLTGAAAPLAIRPSEATTVRQGFATVCRFFPGVRDVLAAIDDELIARLLGTQDADEARAFEDQYASTGGQIYGLAMGHDRFVADLRPLMQSVADERKQALGHCCHPYDICTALIAEQAGVVVRDPTGENLAATLDTKTKITWVGYANEQLYATIEPVLQEILSKRNL